MSCSRGNVSRTRAQKHKNRHVFKNDLHDKTPTQQKINSLHVCEVCERCKLQIEWKIKYKKYKPLSQAKTCIKCSNRTVKKAYHVICRDCAVKARICAKCLKSASEVNIEPPGPTEQEQIQLKVEMERLIDSLPERKRRTFLRYMKKGKEDEMHVPTEAVEGSLYDLCLQLDFKIFISCRKRGWRSTKTESTASATFQRWIVKENRYAEIVWAKRGRFG